MQQVVDDGLPGGFVPTICGALGSNVSAELFEAKLMTNELLFDVQASVFTS
jgi:hypothetical protein